MGIEQGAIESTPNPSTIPNEGTERFAREPPGRGPSVGPAGPPEADFRKKWEWYKGGNAGIFTTYAIFLLILIILFLLYEIYFPHESDARDLVLWMAMVIVIVLLALCIKALATLARVDPYPAVFEDGVRLVKFRLTRLDVVSGFYQYRELESPRRRPGGLQVSSVDGKTWILSRGIWDDEWLSRIEQRIIRARTGRDAPHRVLPPKAAGRRGA